MKKIKILFLSSILHLFAFNIFGQVATLIETDKIKEELINQSVPIIGSILPKKESTLMSSVAGRVDKVLVEEGEKVLKNNILAHVDLKNYEWLYEISLSNLKKAKLNYEAAKLETIINDLDYKRMEALKNSSAFNGSKFDKLEKTLLILQSKEDIALAELNIEKNKNKIAKLNYEKSVIRAPFSGVIEKKMIEVGEVVAIGSSIFNLVNKEKLEVFAEIPSFRAYSLKQGNAVKISTTDNIEFQGTIRALGVKENPTTRTVKIYLDFSNNEISRKVLVGENVNLLIPVSFGKKAITIHKDAILKREGMSLAYLVKNDIVEIRPLKLGEAVGNRFIVNSGLVKDDTVVIKGNERLRPGQKVKVITK